MLIGRAGNDILDGGTGTDRADWVRDGGTVGVNADGRRNRDPGTEIDSLINTEDLRGTNSPTRSRATTRSTSSTATRVRTP